MADNAVLWETIRAYLYVSAIAKFDSSFGLPCFIFYSRTFQLLLKVWAGCYEAAISALGFSEFECLFFFRWFMFGAVLDNDEIQDLLALALRYCSKVTIPYKGWEALEEFFRFASQHGRRRQQWGVECIRWIRTHRLDGYMGIADWV